MTLSVARETDRMVGEDASLEQIMEVAMPSPPFLEWIAQLRDPSPYLRQKAARSLSQSATAESGITAAAAAGLKTALSDANKYVRIAASSSLTAVDPTAAPTAVETLSALLQDEHRDVRLAALQALAALGPATAHAALEAVRALASSDPLPAVRAQAALALASLTPVQAAPPPAPPPPPAAPE